MREFAAIGFAVVVAAAAWAVVWIISTVEEWLFPKSPPPEGPRPLRMPPGLGGEGESAGSSGLPPED